MRVARCIPPDKIDWTYAPAKFTLGDLLRHLAVTERYMWAENVQGRPARYTTHGRELAADYDSVMAFVEHLHAESMEIFGRLTDEDLQKKCKTPDDAPNHYVEVAALDGRTRTASHRSAISNGKLPSPDFKLSKQVQPKKAEFLGSEKQIPRFVVNVSS